MNSKDFHEKVSDILAKVLDLPYDKGLVKIDKLCADDEPLKKEVLALYLEMQDDESKETQTQNQPIKDKTKLVGRKDSRF